MVANTSDSIASADQEEASIASQIKIYIWEDGKKIGSAEMVSISMFRGKSIKGSFWMGRNMGEEFIIIEVELAMMGSGIKIGKMDLEFLHMPMERNMRGIG
jgi:hypothetical protein